MSNLLPSRWSRRPTHPNSERLRAIRTALRMTQGEMADALGVHISTIRNWEYGTLSSPPSREMMDVAEALMREPSEQVKRLLKLNGRELVGEWCRTLSLTHDDYAGLALHLGVARTTPFRWMSESSQPPVSVLCTIDDRVAEVRAKIDAAPPACRELHKLRVTYGRPLGRFASVFGLEGAQVAAMERGESEPAAEDLARIRQHLHRPA